MKHLLKQVMTEKLQNKKKIEESSKKEECGDEKHVFPFTWPNGLNWAYRKDLFI